MCRWAAYIGAPIYLEDVISAPEQSLMRQSLHARESKTETNGDGFGIAWYGDRKKPGVYHEVLPAWADHNLKSIAHQVQSRLFLAHVRASTGTATSRTNCHPFTVGEWSFMHNGQVGGYAGFRRQIDMMIDEDCYAHRNGTTDSEALFLLALGLRLRENPKRALELATGRMEALSRASGDTPHMRMTVAFTDGTVLYAARYASDAFAPSLYHRRAGGPDGWCVVSEPLERGAEVWTELPPNSFAVVTPDGVEIQPFAPVNDLA